MTRLVGGICLLVGVLLIHRGLHKPRPVAPPEGWTVFDMAKWAKLKWSDPELHAAVEKGVSDGAVLGFALMDEPEGDQGGWPTHDGGAA
jgi:hypothetical protein